MPEYLAPGVYVEETSFRSKSIEGVATTTTGFVGPTRYGPTNRVPDVLTSLADYERVYGDGDQLDHGAGAVHNYMWHSVRAFFENGGRRLYVSRIVRDDAAFAAGPVTVVPAALALTGDLAGTTNFPVATAAGVLPGSFVLERATPTTTVTGATLLASAGAGPTFPLNLAQVPDAGPVTVQWTSGGASVQQIITGTTAAGDGNPAGTTIDRATGAITLDTTGDLPDAATPITADFTYADTRRFIDNGAGQIVGDAGATGVLGSIDYATGTATIIFTTAPPSGEAWNRSFNTAGADISARFPGDAGNGTLRFVARAGQNLLTTPATMPAGIVAGDIVEVLHNTWRTGEWRRVTGGVGTWAFDSLRAEDRDANNRPVAGLSNASHALDANIVRIAKATSVSVVFTRIDQNDKEVLAGLWDGIDATPAAVQEYFSAEPASDERARTLPVIITTLSNDTLHGGTVTLVGGTDGSAVRGQDYEGREDPITDVKTGLKAFEDIEDISIVAAPGIAALTDADQAATAVDAVKNHVERMRYRVGIIDSMGGHSIGEVRQFRARFDSKHLALYYPWVRMLDPITGREITLPPSGFVAGIYARNDINRAVYKAPANEVVNLALGFERTLNKAQQEVLNPEGINCLRFFEGRGMRVWGARTMSSDPEWKYINVRRYFAYLEHSIDRGTQWAVFEPNGPLLWGNIRRTIEDFLLNEFQSGALLGDKPEKSFFVRCDRSTMTQNDLDNGRLICLIGVAPLKPAEFVIFRIGQWTADAKN